MEKTAFNPKDYAVQFKTGSGKYYFKELAKANLVRGSLASRFTKSKFAQKILPTKIDLSNYSHLWHKENLYSIKEREVKSEWLSKRYVSPLKVIDSDTGEEVSWAPVDNENLEESGSVKPNCILHSKNTYINAYDNPPKYTSKVTVSGGDLRFCLYPEDSLDRVEKIFNDYNILYRSLDSAEKHLFEHQQATTLVLTDPKAKKYFGLAMVFRPDPEDIGHRFSDQPFIIFSKDSKLYEIKPDTKQEEGEKIKYEYNFAIDIFRKLFNQKNARALTHIDRSVGSYEASITY